MSIESDKNSKDIREQYRLETGMTPENTFQECANCPEFEDGITDEYAEWIENKLSEHRNEDDTSEVNLPIKRVRLLLPDKEIIEDEIKFRFSGEEWVMQPKYFKAGAIYMLGLVKHLNSNKA